MSSPAKIVYKRNQYCTHSVLHTGIWDGCEKQPVAVLDVQQLEARYTTEGDLESKLEAECCWSV